MNSKKVTISIDDSLFNSLNALSSSTGMTLEELIPTMLFMFYVDLVKETERKINE